MEYIHFDKTCNLCEKKFRTSEPDQPVCISCMIRCLSYAPAGTEIWVDGERWMKLRDNSDHNLEGYFVNLNNGNYKHVSMVYETWTRDD